MFDQPTGIDWNGSQGYGIVKYGEETHLIVMFYIKAVHNPLKSNAHGAPIHDDVEYVRMHPPGERLNIIDRPVVANDKVRFKERYKAFKDGREQLSPGIPIELLFPMHPSIGQNLRGAGIHTIEQCANMSGHASDVIGMGAVDFQNRAKQYLGAATGGGAFHKLQKEVEEKDLQIRRLNEEMGQLRNQFVALQNAIQNPGQYLVPGAMVPGTPKPEFQQQPGGIPLHVATAAQRQNNKPAEPLEQAKVYMNLPEETAIPNPWGNA